MQTTSIDDLVDMAVMSWPVRRISKKTREEMREIVEYVEKRRAKEGVIPTYGRKLEPSCEAFGEAYNLMECQLIPRPYDDGMENGWIELLNPGVREIVLDYVRTGKRFH